MVINSLPGWQVFDMIQKRRSVWGFYDDRDILVAVVDQDSCPDVADAVHLVAERLKVKLLETLLVS